WAWNLALAAAAWALLRLPNPQEPAAGPLSRIAAFALWLLPVLYELGLVGAAYSHELYACVEPHATWLRADGSVVPVGELPGFPARLPASRWIYVQWFERVASPGDRLVVHDRRPLALGRVAEEVFAWPR